MQMFLGGLSSVAPPQSAYFLGCWMIRGLENGGNFCPKKIEPGEERRQNVTILVHRGLLVGWLWLLMVRLDSLLQRPLSLVHLNNVDYHELGCWSWWPNHLPRNDPMDSIQVGKAVFEE